VGPRVDGQEGRVQLDVRAVSAYFLAEEVMRRSRCYGKSGAHAVGTDAETVTTVTGLPCHHVFAALAADGPWESRRRLSVWNPRSNKKYFFSSADIHLNTFFRFWQHLFTGYLFVHSCARTHLQFRSSLVRQHLLQGIFSHRCAFIATL
jgi:hypothetical protein